MGLFVITPDDDGYNTHSPTFLVYDDATKELVHRCEKVPALDCKQVIGRPTFRPFGLTSNEKYLYVASHHRLGIFDKHTYQFIDILDVPLFINTHEIVACDGFLYVANTANDTIGVHGTKDSSSIFFNINTFDCTDSAPTPVNVNSHDTSHVNSLCVHEGKIYFSLHHLGRRISQLGCFDIKTFKAEIIAEAGVCAHGVRVLNKKLYSLSTGTGEIIEVDLATKEVILHRVVNPALTFLRGLDTIEGSLVFGGSNTYSEERTIYMGNCFIGQFNTETKKATVRMSVDDAYIMADMKVLN